MKSKLLIPLLIFLFVIILTNIFSASIVNANDGVLGVTPDGVYPITQADIMMVSEEIHIDCSTGKVSCRFDFKNFGPAQRVTMGFPAMLNERYYLSELGTEEDISVHNFTARDKNGEIPVHLADTIPNPPLIENRDMVKYTKWYAFTVDFAENEEKTLYHTYDVKFTHFSNGDVIMGYVIETGALWNGPIGHSKVIFDFGDIPMYSIVQVYPYNFYRIEGNKLIFERSEFKPDYNLSVTMNQARYIDLDWFDWNYAGNETKEIAKSKIELFKTSPDAIRKESQKYYQFYKELIKTDPISALYIKSMLNLPNGSEKPEIIQSAVTKREGNTWYFDIKAEDPDGDIIGWQAKNDLMEKFKYDDHVSNITYVAEEHGFVGSGYFSILEDVQEPTPFSITFRIYDSMGNSDSVTMLLIAEPPVQTAPEPSATPETSAKAQDGTSEQAENGGQKPLEASEQDEDEADVRETFENFGNSQKPKVIPTEKELVPLLVSGVIFILVICCLAIILLWIRKRSWGYLFYIIQLIFIAIGFSPFIEVLNLRDVTDSIMSSELISLKIGISAVFLALSMFSMLAGIVFTVRKNEKQDSNMA